MDNGVISLKYLLRRRLALDQFQQLDENRHHHNNQSSSLRCFSHTQTVQVNEEFSNGVAEQEQTKNRHFCFSLYKIDNTNIETFRHRVKQKVPNYIGFKQQATETWL